MIKYRYALDLNDNLVDILDLERNIIKKTDKYFTVDYKQELIPRLGKIKVKHFALKPNINALGSKETYLHALGKKVFKDEYLDSLNKGEPFYVNYEAEVECPLAISRYEVKCNQPVIKCKYDLTQYFTKIEEELRDENLIPDLLLINTATGTKLYIEIAVTHFVSDKKKESGTRIIEIELKSESDIQTIKNLKSGWAPKNIKCYNFQIKRQKLDFCDEKKCNCYFDVFEVSEEGQCTLYTDVPQSGLKSIKNKKFSIYPIKEKYWNRESAVFKKYVLNAQKLSYNPKNCLICKYKRKPKRNLDNGDVYCNLFGCNYVAYNKPACNYFIEELGS